MIWLFASVVLLLAVFHEQFRKVLYWCAGIVCVLIALFVYGQFRMDAQRKQEMQQASMSSASFDPYAYDPAHPYPELEARAAGHIVGDPRTEFFKQGASSSSSSSSESSDIWSKMGHETESSR